MEVCNIKALTQTRLLFIERIDFPAIYNHLIQAEVISVYQKDEILQFGTKAEQATKLHDILLLSQDEDMFDGLCEVLQETDNDVLYNALLKKRERIQQKITAKTDVVVSPPSPVFISRTSVTDLARKLSCEQESEVVNAAEARPAGVNAAEARPAGVNAAEARPVVVNAAEARPAVVHCHEKMPWQTQSVPMPIPNKRNDLQDSCSLTPPNSPTFTSQCSQPVKKCKVHHEFNMTSDLCFNCDRPLDNKQITERILHPNDSVPFDLTAPVCLFGSLTSPNHVINNTNHYFSIVRQKGHCILEAAKSIQIGSHSGHSDEMWHLRAEIRGFYQLLFTIVQSNITSVCETFIPELLRQCKFLLNDFGTLSEFLFHGANRTGYKINSPCYHYVHLLLDVQLSCCEILFYLYTSETYASILSSTYYCLHSDYETHNIHYLQHVYLMLHDLTNIATHNFNQVPLADVNTKLFPCSCFEQFLSVIIELLTANNEHSFWSCFNNVVVDILDEEQKKVTILDTTLLELRSLACGNRTLFIWIYTAHIATICARVTDEDPRGRSMTNNYELVRRLLKKQLSGTFSQNPSASEFSKQLQCYSVMTEHWAADVETFTMVWDYVAKIMNESHSKPMFGIKGYMDERKDSLTLFENCIEKQAKRCSTVFEWFLNILCQQLQKCDLAVAKKLKGRIFTKFHQRRMQELTQTGVEHFSELFLTLAHQQDTEDVALRALEYYQMLPNVTKASVDGQFAFLFLYQHKEMNMKLPIKLITRGLAQLYKRFTFSKGDQPSVWHQVMLYLYNIQTIVEKSPSLSYGEHLLLEVSVVDKLNVQQLQQFTEHMEAVLMKFRTCYMNYFESVEGFRNEELLSSYQNFSDRLWQYFETFQKLSLTFSPPTQLSDILVLYTHMAKYLPPSAGTHMGYNYKNCIKNFAFNWNVNPSSRMSFLCSILSTPDLSAELPLLFHDCETSLVQAWMQCAWFVDQHDPQFQYLTQHIIRYLDVEVSAADGLCQFLIQLQDSLTIVTTLEERCKIKSKSDAYFSDTVPTMKKALQTNEDNAFKWAGKLLQHCPKLIYTKSQSTCLLPQILDKLEINSVCLMNKQKPFKLKRHVALYLEALSSFDINTDPYIKRKIRDLVTATITRIPVKQGPVDELSYPLLVSLHSSTVQNHSDQCVRFRTNVVMQLNDEFLGLTDTIMHEHGGNVLLFLLILFRHTSNSILVLSDGVLLCRRLLLIMLFCANKIQKSHGFTILQQILQAYDATEHQSLHDQLQQQILSFCGTQMKVHPVRILNLLESLVPFSAALLTPKLSDLTKLTLAAERLRGAGVNKQLRVAYFSLLAHLGEAGAAEKSKLLRQKGILDL